MRINNKVVNVNALLVLPALAKYKSKRKTAVDLNLSNETLSRYIQYLEDIFKTKLVHNTSTGCVLTPRGAQIAETVGNVEDILESIYHENGIDSGEYKGEVRVVIPLAASVNLLPYDAVNLAETYPDIRITSLSLPDCGNPEQEDADLYIHLQRPENLDKYTLLYEKDVAFGLFASARYLNQFGYPQNIEDLCMKHRLVHKIGSERYISGWKEIIDKCQNVYYKTDSSYSLMQVIRYGLGIGIMPQRFKDEGFILIDNMFCESKKTLYLVANKKSAQTARVKVVADYYQLLLSRM